MNHQRDRAKWLVIAALLVGASELLIGGNPWLSAAVTEEHEPLWFESLPADLAPIGAPATAPLQARAPALGTPESIFVAPEGAAAPEVRILNQQGAQVASFFAYNPSFRGGVRVATGDVNNDGRLDVLASTGDGLLLGSLVRLFTIPNLTPMFVGEGHVFPQSFVGGVYVAMGDVNGDGFDDVIAGAGTGGAGAVRVFSLQGGVNVLANFVAFPEPLGVHVAAGDLNGDGRAEIITGQGAGGGPHVALFQPQGNSAIEIGRGLAFDPSFRGGVRVATGDFNGDGRDEVIVGAGPGGGPHVRVFSIFPVVREVANFFAFEPGFTGGVNVAAGDINGDGRDELLVASGAGRVPTVRVFDGLTFNLVHNFPIVFGDNYTGSTTVSAGTL